MNSEFHTASGPDGQKIVDWQKGSLAELAHFQAARNPDLEILTFLGDGCNETGRLTAWELDKKAANIASWLQKILKPKQRVVLLFENGPEYLLGLFGCAYAGMTPVSGVYPTDFGSRQRFCHIVKDSNAIAVIGNKMTLSSFQKECQSEKLNILWIPIELSERDDGYYYHPAGNLNESLVQYTSGSTSTPKGVILTGRNVLFNLMQQGIKLGYTQGDVGVSWLPLSHDMGLMGAALMAIAAGGQCVLLPPEKFLQTPTNWLRAISKYKATLSGAPGFSYDMCTNFEDDLPDDVDLSKWEQAFVGAESISFETIENFSSKFSKYGFKKTSFCPCYGLAEATLLVSSKERKETVSIGKFSRKLLTEGKVTSPLFLEDERILVSCGKIIDETRLLVVKDEIDFSLAEENEEGLLYISGPSISNNYCGYGKQIENGINFNDIDYIYTGDKGFFYNGDLFLTGRKNNEIIINGFKIDPEDFVFSISQKIKGISQNNSTIFLENSTPIFVCSLLKANNNENKALDYHIERIFEEIFKIKNAEIWYINQSSFIKTPSGKINISRTKSDLFQNKNLILKIIKIQNSENFILYGMENH